MSGLVGRCHRSGQAPRCGSPGPPAARSRLPAPLVTPPPYAATKVPPIPASVVPSPRPGVACAAAPGALSGPAGNWPSCHGRAAPGERDSLSLHRCVPAGSGFGSVHRLHAHARRDRRLAGRRRGRAPGDRAAPARAPPRRRADERRRQSAATPARCRVRLNQPPSMADQLCALLASKPTVLADGTTAMARLLRCA
jgi:hypothetical protein